MLASAATVSAFGRGAGGEGCGCGRPRLPKLLLTAAVPSSVPPSLATYQLAHAGSAPGAGVLITCRGGKRQRRARGAKNVANAASIQRRQSVDTRKSVRCLSISPLSLGAQLTWQLPGYARSGLVWHHSHSMRSYSIAPLVCFFVVRRGVVVVTIHLQLLYPRGDAVAPLMRIRASGACTACHDFPVVIGLSVARRGDQYACCGADFPSS